MSELVSQAVTALNAKMDGEGLEGGPAKFVISDEGAIMIDEAGARAGDEDAEVTLTADAETFQSILEGDLDPTAAFMQGKLSIDGDMGLAMKLAAVLG
ncbi:SCP2 sterol-binding domain-containing protein [Limimaricola sp.]|uniref:SCP2 sterol-binding domain-containing protein n=1 Tax=Limimaricola sp. TaxID=2211665 RepID=UPI004059A1AE